MRDRIFPAWSEDLTSMWGKQPLKIAHNLHESPLFSRPGLAALIEAYPREYYNLMYTGAVGDRKTWREGDTAGMSGAQVIEAIANGRLWLNLRRTGDVDHRYRELLDGIFAEIAEHVPAAEGYPFTSFGILISSPGAQVYYHADLPDQALWQIVGRKKVWVYPPLEPFISGEDLERIAVYETELDLRYCAWYDKYAAVYDLEPGEMLYWPLNSPHRVENYDCLNVSVTTEYWSRRCQLSNRINVANGLLRFRLGIKPHSRATNGPSFLTKAALSSFLSRTGWLKKVRKEQRPIEFKLDKVAVGRIIDLGADRPGSMSQH